MTQHLTADRLDADTLAYLKRVTAAAGKRMPGIYYARPNHWPLIGLIVGVVILALTAIVTLPPTEEPAKEAMLQTAGFLLGGWLVLAALRVWSAVAAGGRFGTFVYADSERLYEVSGAAVAVTDLREIDEARVTQNFNEGAYQNSHIALKLGAERKSFTLHSERVGRRMSVFLNALAYMRGGGEGGADEQLKALPANEMAAVALHVAQTGNFPRSMAEVEEPDAADIPEPRGGESRGRGGLIWYLAIIGAGAVLFLGFRTFNKAVREDTIYGRIMALPAKDQPPALRLYLSNPDFQQRRADAAAKLDTAYREAAATTIRGNNPEFAEAMRMLVMALAKKPQAVVSLAVEEEGAAPAKAREDAVALELADKWGSTIGDEFVVFARPATDEVKAMIHVAYRLDGPAVTYTVTFRFGPDDPPFKTINGTTNALGGPNEFNVPGFPDHLLGESCGVQRQRPIVLPDQEF